MMLPKYLTTVTTFSKILAMILFITLPIIGFAFGIQYQRTIYLSQENLINIQPTPTNTSIDNTLKLFVDRLCKNKAQLNDYEGGLIFKCGNYYKVQSPPNLMDAPDVIFDSKGDYIVSCGGMPGPNGYNKKNPICSIVCQNLNLYLCSSNTLPNNSNKKVPNSPPDATSSESANIGTYKGVPVKP